MINPSLKFNNAFMIKVEKCLGDYFSIGAIKTIKNCLMKKNTSIMALILIYENIREIPKQLYSVLSRVFNTLIENYVCIDYL